MVFIVEKGLVLLQFTLRPAVITRHQTKTHQSLRNGACRLHRQQLIKKEKFIRRVVAFAIQRRQFLENQPVLRRTFQQGEKDVNRIGIQLASTELAGKFRVKFIIIGQVGKDRLENFVTFNAIAGLSTNLASLQNRFRGFDVKFILEKVLQDPQLQIDIFRLQFNHFLQDAGRIGSHIALLIKIEKAAVLGHGIADESETAI